MERVLSIIKRAGLECLPCERLNVDFERFSEYRDSHEHPIQSVFERPALTGRKKTVAEVTRGCPTILRYFLDGSRRAYKVADVVKRGRFLPLVAGQIGVAVTWRPPDIGGMELLHDYCHFRNILAFPSFVTEDDLQDLRRELDESAGAHFELVGYSADRDRDPVDLGVAKIMKEMHDLEVATVLEMVDGHLLANDSLLVIDGPLRFWQKFDPVEFRNVVGLSKSFRPSFAVGRGRRKQDVGSITAGLGFRERSSVFKTMEKEKTIGMWYLRIRLPRMMSNPLQGVVKMECYAADPDDRENGFDAERIDVISDYLLRERNVTPYGADLRWATHIYPIYLAESYLKASFMSDVRFKALF